MVLAHRSYNSRADSQSDTRTDTELALTLGLPTKPPPINALGDEIANDHNTKNNNEVPPQHSHHTKVTYHPLQPLQTNFHTRESFPPPSKPIAFPITHPPTYPPSITSHHLPFQAAPDSRQQPSLRLTHYPSTTPKQTSVIRMR